MNLIERIRTHEQLAQYVCSVCEENGVGVSFDIGVSPEMYVIVKPDAYYNSSAFGAERPASADCFIVQMCNEAQYKLVIVELKNIQHAKDISAENIRQKFRTCLEDFIPHRFPNLLDVEYKDIKLYFVSHIDIYHKRDKQNLGLTIETLMETRFKYKDRKNIMLHLQLPNPTIKNCY
jgi:hypothetical protein